MAEVDLDRVESGLDAEPGTALVVGGDAGDVVLGGRPGEPQAEGVEHPAGGDPGHSVGRGVGHRSGVADLGGGQGPLGVHGVGEASQARNCAGDEQHAPRVGASFRGHRQVGDGGERGATGGHPPVELHQVVGDHPLG